MSTGNPLWGAPRIVGDRPRVIHFNATANPTTNWTARQLVKAFPWQDPASVRWRKGTMSVAVPAFPGRST
jgi:hypothetical protein